VSDDLRIERVERALRDAHAPLETPARLREVARTAALGGRLRRRRPVALALAATLAAAAALAVGISLRDDAVRPEGAYTIAMAGPAGASGRVAVSDAEGGVRRVSISLDHLQPADGGSWYEMWYSSADGRWKVASFDVPSSGRVQFDTTIPAAVSWTRCWVSLRSPSAKPVRVLVSS
jgi:hypothetical protein